MVFICSTDEYPNDKNNEFHFSKFAFSLHIFQKWAIEAIITGNHILVTAPTGSGKSLPAEFAIDYFHSLGKKSIYCSPIKALSNQKYYDFSRKYPHISIGLITGDIKTNPDADVLIMTTEILLNKLQQTTSSSFDLNIETELGCVIFDEIHMINDPARGHVWETSILKLPSHVQIVGLSATLDNPEKFATWLEKSRLNSDKCVYLAKRYDRAVPLTHYSFITCTQGLYKALKDKALEEEIKQTIKRPLIIQNAAGEFQEGNYKKVTKVLDLLRKKNIRIHRQHVLNELAEYLKENEMLPAISYVFSRKQLEICAHEITSTILPFDSKIPYTVDEECEKIIRKLPNFREYLELPEYINLVQLLRKGIAIHHSGLAPILREMVEILFERGFVKLLFATESVAIGLNLPVKTSIFTDIWKHDGSWLRILEAHEYTQAAGRAGRLGLDTVGHVIHLNNLFRETDAVLLKKMLDGKPQKLESKFTLTVSQVLQHLALNKTPDSLFEYMKQSMLFEENQRQLESARILLQQCTEELDDAKLQLSCNWDELLHYRFLLNKLPTLKNAQKREITKEIEQTKTCIKEDYLNFFSRIEDLQIDCREHQEDIQKLSLFCSEQVHNILNYLQEEQCLVWNKSNNTYDLTIMGQIASQLRECDSVVFACLLKYGCFDKIDAIELCAVLSCMTSVTVGEDYTEILPDCASEDVNWLATYLKELLEDHSREYEENSCHFDLLYYIMEWCQAEDEVRCKWVLQEMGKNKGIFLGEFIKALLKINNMAAELEKAAEQLGNILLLKKLREIPSLTLKYVATNQSLYL